VCFSDTQDAVALQLTPEATCAASLGCLSSLSALTYLSVAASNLPVGPDVWAAVAKLTQLQELEMFMADLTRVDGLLHLTALQNLWVLSLTVDYHTTVRGLDLSRPLRHQYGERGRTRCRWQGLKCTAGWGASMSLAAGVCGAPCLSRTMCT
jgi:hypothetical protein